MQTHIPIVNCTLEYQSNKVNRKDYIIVYLVDMLANIYTFNLTHCLQINEKIQSQPQPIKVTTLYHNLNLKLLSQQHTAHQEYPLLLTKYENVLTTVSLRGTIKLFDFNQMEEKSFMNHITLEPVEVQLPCLCLAACHNRNQSTLGQVVVLALNNLKVPYVFVNATTAEHYK